ncbi:MAG: hypothetical protein O0X93_06935, partial [Methanocorpusculum sp.]|nr:hypothetical protein [Methanocorpusculum sp.]
PSELRARRVGPHRLFRGGRPGAVTPRPRVRMLAEGSVFCVRSGRSRFGRVVRVRESPPVVEYGMMFPCPFEFSGGRR